MGGAVLNCLLQLLLLLFPTGLSSLGAASLQLTPYPNVTFKINEIVTFNCSLDAADSNNASSQAIEWYLNNVPIQNSTSAALSLVSAGKNSQLEILGASEHDLNLVTCVVAIGSPPFSNRSTLLILTRDIESCTINQDASNFCFTCELADDIIQIKLLYRLLLVATDEVVFQDEVTTTIGKGEVDKCIPLNMDGLYRLQIYVVNSFNATTLNNPAFVIDDDVVIERSVTSQKETRTAPVPSQTTENNLLLDLQTWRYRLYVYVGAAVILLAFILVSLGITVCIIIAIRKKASVDIPDLDKITLQPFQPISSSTGNQHHHQTTSSMNRTAGTNNRTSTSMVSSSQVSTTHMQGSNTFTQVATRSSMQMQTIAPAPAIADGDDSSIESIYDRLEDNTEFKGHIEC